MQESFGFNVKFHYHLDVSGEGLHVRGLFTPATRSSEDILPVCTCPRISLRGWSVQV